MTTTSLLQPVGQLLRLWRQRRRHSQLELALEANVSARHISFLETGRSLPSRNMVLHLCERMDVPLRERNIILVAAGYAPTFSEKSLEDANLSAVRKAMEIILAGHEPYPALVIDRYWTAVAFNKMVPVLLRGVAPDLLKPPVNVMRLCLNPGGLAPRIVNLPQWRAHLLTRLRRQIDDTADVLLTDLYQEVASYATGGIATGKKSRGDAPDAVVIPLRLATTEGELVLFSATTLFGAPRNVTVSELAIEAFYPADADSRERLQRLFPSD